MPRIMSTDEYGRIANSLDGLLTDDQELHLTALMIADQQAEYGVSLPAGHTLESANREVSLRAIKQVIARSESPLVRIDGGWVSITTFTPDPTYEFQLDRCDTPEQLMGWVHQLSHKMWVTRDHIDSLVCTIANHFGWGLSV